MIKSCTIDLRDGRLDGLPLTRCLSGAPGDEGLLSAEDIAQVRHARKGSAKRAAVPVHLECVLQDGVALADVQALLTRREATSAARLSRIRVILDFAADPTGVLPTTPSNNSAILASPSPVVPVPAAGGRSNILRRSASFILRKQKEDADALDRPNDVAVSGRPTRLPSSSIISDPSARTLSSQSGSGSTLPRRSFPTANSITNSLTQSNDQHGRSAKQPVRTLMDALRRLAQDCPHAPLMSARVGEPPLTCLNVWQASGICAVRLGAVEGGVVDIRLVKWTPRAIVALIGAWRAGAAVKITELDDGSDTSSMLWGTQGKPLSLDSEDVEEWGDGNCTEGKLRTPGGAACAICSVGRDGVPWAVSHSSLLQHTDAVVAALLYRAGDVVLVALRPLQGLACAVLAPLRARCRLVFPLPRGEPLFAAMYRTQPTCAVLDIGAWRCLSRFTLAHSDHPYTDLLLRQMGLLRARLGVCVTRDNEEVPLPSPHGLRVRHATLSSNTPAFVADIDGSAVSSVELSQKSAESPHSPVSVANWVRELQKHLLVGRVVPCKGNSALLCVSSHAVALLADDKGLTGDGWADEGLRLEVGQALKAAARNAGVEKIAILPPSDSIWEDEVILKLRAESVAALEGKKVKREEGKKDKKDDKKDEKKEDKKDEKKEDKKEDKKDEKKEAKKEHKDDKKKKKK